MPATPKGLIQHLHLACGEVMKKTFADDREADVSSIYIFVDQLQAWDAALGDRPEIILYQTAQDEYLSAILSICQGRYRSAFKSLRLTLELYLQGIYLSVDELSLREWLANSRDTNWSAIVHADGGVFGNRFTRVFFPELDDKRKYIENIARTLYRELSECIHGNIPQMVKLPRSIEFSDESFEVFMKKCDALKLIIHFSLALRYLRGLKPTEVSSLEGILLEELGYLGPIRLFFEGA